MRILVNAINLRSPGTRITGQALLAAFARLDTSHEFLFVVPEGFGYEEVPLGTRTRLLTRRLPRWWPLWRIWFDFVGLGRIAREEGAQALIALTNHAPARLGIPKVVLCRSVFYGTSPDVGAATRGARYALERWLFGFTARSADVLVAQTEHVAEGLARSWGVPRSRLRIIPNALTPEIVQGARGATVEPASLPGGIPADAFVLLYPSRYYPYKNHELLLETARVLDERGRRDLLFVTTVGQGPPDPRPFLDELASRGTGRILNLGEIPQAELNRWYRRAGALVFPSRAETFGNGLLEGMAWGLPVLAADRPYARDVCGDALLPFPPDDPVAVADLCERIADDPQLRSEMAARSRSRREAFPSWDEVAAEFVALVEALATRPLSASPVLHGPFE